MNTMKKATLENAQQSQQEGSSSTQDKRESKFEKYDIEHTPFTVIEEPEGEYESTYYVTLGRYRMTNGFNSLEEAQEDAKKITWDKIIQVAGILIETESKINREKITI